MVMQRRKVPGMRIVELQSGLTYDVTCRGYYADPAYRLRDQLPRSRHQTNNLAPPASRLPSQMPPYPYLRS